MKIQCPGDKCTATCFKMEEEECARYNDDCCIDLSVVPIDALKKELEERGVPEQAVKDKGLVEEDI